MEKEEGRKTSSNNKKMMVCIDLSESSYHVLIWVLENLKELITECPLIIFATQPLQKFNYVIGASMAFAWVHCPLSPTAALTIHNQERNRKELLAILEKARGICSKRGVKVETYLGFGDPKEDICNAVQEQNINLLVIGDSLKRFFTGSLSNHCLNEAKCPVIVVNHPE